MHLSVFYFNHIVLVCCHVSHQTLTQRPQHAVTLTILTPSSNRQFNQVVFVDGVKHLYQHEIQVKCLNSHPGKAAEQRVMQECCDKYAHPVRLCCGAPLCQQEGRIQQKQGPAQRYVNRKWAIPTVVSKKREQCTDGHLTSSQEHKIIWDKSLC